MKRFAIPMILSVLLPSAASAATYGPLYNSGSLALRYGSATIIEPFDRPDDSYATFATGATGMAETQIVLTGFNIQYLNGTNPLRRFRLVLEIQSYDPATGEILWGVDTRTDTSVGIGSAYSVDVQFVIIQTDGVFAHLSEATAGCASAALGACIGSGTAVGAKPLGEIFYNFALQGIDMTTLAPGGSGIPVNGIFAGVNMGTVSGTDVQMNGGCSLADAAGDKGVACALRGVGLAVYRPYVRFEAVDNLGDIGAAHLALPSTWTVPGDNVGASLGLRFFSLAFDTNDYKLWRWQAGAKDLNVTLSSTDFVDYTRTGYLGNTFGTDTTPSFTVNNSFLGYGIRL